VSVSLHDEIPARADVVVLGPDVDGEGIRFDSATAGSLISDITEATARAGRIVVVSGAGRGVGCTTVALHLAAEFARTHETCYVDFDTTFGAADRLGFDGEHQTWSDVDGSSESLLLAALPVTGGFRALLAPTGAEPPRDLLGRAASAFDRVVVDCPGDGALDMSLQASDAVVVVVPASGLGARRLDRIIDRFDQVPHALVANRTGPGSEATRSNLARVIGRKISIELPCSARLRDAEDRGLLLTSPLSRWKWSIARLARALDHA
jgi:cellulose biosynthesis protein BcsQ